MTTTLQPPPNEAEKKFLMDAFILFKEDGMRLSSVGHTNDDCFAKAEDLLQSFRSRYGAPQEAEEPTTQDFQAAHIESLQAFKNYVHKRLDDAGIPTHPDGEHSKAGCRIGDRLDIALKSKPEDMTLREIIALLGEGEKIEIKPNEEGIIWVYSDAIEQTKMRQFYSIPELISILKGGE